MCKSAHHQPLFDAICKASGISDLTEVTKRPANTFARFVAIKFLREHANYSYCMIAHFLNRDISTIYFGEARYKQLEKSNEEFKALINKVKKEMEAVCQ